MRRARTYAGDVTETADGCASGIDAPAGRADVRAAQRLTAPRTFKALPTWAMAGGREPQAVDARVHDDVIWILRRYHLRVTAARELGHRTHGDGTAIDLVPADGATQPVWDASAGRLARDLGWDARCAASGTRPACPLVPPIRFIGYDGFPRHGSPRTCGTGCPAHLHISWVSGCFGGRPALPALRVGAGVRSTARRGRPTRSANQIVRERGGCDRLVSMTALRRRATCLLTVLPACIALAAPASAADRHVSVSGVDNAECSTAAPCATIQHADDVAQDGDRIVVGPGLFAGSADLRHAGALVGAGAGATVIRARTTTALLIRPPSFSLSAVRVEGPDAPEGNDLHPAVARPTGTTGRFTTRLVGVALAARAAGSQALAVLGPSTDAPAHELVAESSTFTTASADPAAVQLADAGVSATFRGSAISTAGGYGIAGITAARVALDHTRVDAGGLAVGSASDVAVTHSILRGGISLAVWSTRAPVAGTVRDSLLRGTVVAERVAPGADVSLALTFTTVVASAPEGAIQAKASDAHVVAITLVNSAVESAAPGVDLRAAGASASIAASHSRFATVVSDAGGRVPAAGSDANRAESAGFADPEHGNFALTPASPLVDAGALAAALPGEVDLAGVPRVQAGRGDACAARPDIGAYELPGPPCVAAVDVATPDTTAPAVGAVRLAPSRFRVGPRRRAAGRGTTLSYSLSEPARAVTAEIQRATSGRRVGRRCRAVSARTRVAVRRRCTAWVREARIGSLPVAAGRNRIRWNGRFDRDARHRQRALRAGRKRLVLVAVDGAGNVGRSRRVAFRVVRA